MEVPNEIDIEPNDKIRHRKHTHKHRQESNRIGNDTKLNKNIEADPTTFDFKKIYLHARDRRIKYKYTPKSHKKYNKNSRLTCEKCSLTIVSDQPHVECPCEHKYHLACFPLSERQIKCSASKCKYIYDGRINGFNFVPYCYDYDAEIVTDKRTFHYMDQDTRALTKILSMVYKPNTTINLVEEYNRNRIGTVVLLDNLIGRKELKKNEFQCSDLINKHKCNAIDLFELDINIDDLIDEKFDLDNLIDCISLDEAILYCGFNVNTIAKAHIEKSDLKEWNGDESYMIKLNLTQSNTSKLRKHRRKHRSKKSKRSDSSGILDFLDDKVEK